MDCPYVLWTPHSISQQKFEMDYNTQKKEMKIDNENKCKAFGIVLEQCREMTKSAVKSDKSFDTLEKGDDVMGLLNLIRDMSYGTNKKRYTNWIQQA